MPSIKPTPPQTRAVNLRVREDTRALIDRAAHAQGRTRSDFMIDAARRAAEEAILDQAVITDQGAYDRFLALLDAPPAPNAALGDLLRRAAPWDEA